MKILDKRIIHLQIQLNKMLIDYKLFIEHQTETVVCKQFNIPLRLLYLKPSNNLTIEARHVVYYILKYHFNFTFYQIAEKDTRNHTTAVNALRKLNKFIIKHPEYKVFIDEMAQKIKRKIAFCLDV